MKERLITDASYCNKGKNYVKQENEDQKRERKTSVWRGKRETIYVLLVIENKYTRSDYIKVKIDNMQKNNLFRLCSGKRDVYGVLDTVVGNHHGDPSSNPGRGC